MVEDERWKRRLVEPRSGGIFVAQGESASPRLAPSANLESRDLEDQFRRYQEMGKKGTGTHGAYANLGIVEVIVF